MRFVQVGEERKQAGSLHTKTLKSGNSAWSGCRRSTRKQMVPERPSNRLQKLAGEREPLLNSSVKRNSANLQGKNKHTACECIFRASLAALYSLQLLKVMANIYRLQSRGRKIIHSYDTGGGSSCL